MLEILPFHFIAMFHSRCLWSENKNLPNSQPLEAGPSCLPAELSAVYAVSPLHAVEHFKWERSSVFKHSNGDWWLVLTNGVLQRLSNAEPQVSLISLDKKL